VQRKQALLAQPLGRYLLTKPTPTLGSCLPIGPTKSWSWFFSNIPRIGNLWPGKDGSFWGCQATANRARLGQAAIETRSWLPGTTKTANSLGSKLASPAIAFRNWPRCPRTAAASRVRRLQHRPISRPAPPGGPDFPVRVLARGLAEGPGRVCGGRSDLKQV
jgi:hypothetical protein